MIDTMNAILDLKGVRILDIDLRRDERQFFAGFTTRPSRPSQLVFTTRILVESGRRREDVEPCSVERERVD